MGYKKRIEVSGTGMVIGEVLNVEDRRVGIKFWSSFINTNKSVERNCKKAHKWADERIRVCKEQEI